MNLTEQILQHEGILKVAVRAVVRNWHDVEDVTQTALMHAIQRQHQFRPGTNLKAWLRRIGRNAGINHYRYTSRRIRNVEIGHAPEPMARVPVDQTLPTWALKRTLRSIKRVYRRVWWLRYVRDMEYKEIAEELELPLGTVMSRLHRARVLSDPVLRACYPDRIAA